MMSLRFYDRKYTLVILLQKNFWEEVYLVFLALPSFPILAPLNKIIGCTKSWLQGFGGDSVFQIKLLRTSIYFILFLENHLLDMIFANV